MGMEFELSAKEFDDLRCLVKEHTGISLSESKLELVRRRFTPRLRALGLGAFADYVRYLKAHVEEELADFASAITTNLTSFFREDHHFDIMAQTALPDLLARNAATRRLRIWCSAASTGQEPYSIAITLLKHIPDIQSWDVRVLATDLDRQCLDKARAGMYSINDLEKVPADVCNRWFLRGRGSNEKHVRVKDSVKEFIDFKPLNLIGNWPMKGPFDIIFCRNVFIYFDKPQQQKIVEKFAGLQYPGAYLFIGHSETLNAISDDYTLIGKTTYQRE
jgi:chemotaxis protein methyltransferase CheR